MAKKKSKEVSNPTPSAARVIQFPNLTPKYDLTCRVLLDDQILVVEELFSAAECKQFVKFIGSLPMELTPPKKKGEADRVNHRFSVTSIPFAQHLHSILLSHLPSFAYPASAKGLRMEGPRLPHSLNSNIRVYKYAPGQYFGPHYDDSVSDTETGAKSEWTLLIYLTGVDDGVQGGETVFETFDKKDNPIGTICVPLTRVMAKSACSTEAPKSSVVLNMSFALT